MNMAKNQFCLFCLIILFYFAIGNETPTSRLRSPVQNDKDITVRQGSSAALNNSHVKITAKDFLLCRVEVILDPICLRFGNLSTLKFSCDFHEESVFYEHNGSPISHEDCLKLKLFAFYKDGTATEILKIKINIIKRDSEENLSINHIDIKEIGGVASFGHEILPKVARSNLSQCEIAFTQDTRWPANGKLTNNQATEPCESFKAIYKHDSSYTPNIDYIPFEIKLRGKRNLVSRHQHSLVLRYHLTVRIHPAQKNNPPFVYSRFSRIVIKQYALKQILASNVRAVDFKSSPNDLLLTITVPKRNNLGGFFTTIERPDLHLEGVTQEQINNKRIMFVSPKVLHKKSRSAIQQIHIQAVDKYGATSKRRLRLMFFISKFVAYYLTVTQNNPIHVLEGQSYTISSWNIDIACKNSKCERAKFSVWSGPHYGKLLKGSKQTNQFTKDDIMRGLLVYKHDGSETLSDSIVLTISDKYQMAYATLSVVIEPFDDSPPFLSVNKEIVTSNYKRTRIETSALKASDHDTVIDRIVFQIKRRPKRGDIVRRKIGGKFENVSEFTEIELENGFIYYEKYSEKPSSDIFSFILSDGGKEPNLSREYISRVRIKAVDRSPPYRTDSGDCVVKINETTRVLSLNFLSYKDTTSSSSEIVFTVTSEQRNSSMGLNEDLVKLKDIFHLKEHKKLPVKNFTQLQVFHNKIFLTNRYYELGLHPKTLPLNFIATDKEGHATAPQTCKIVILPVDNLPPRMILPKPLKVLEGGFMCVDAEMIVLRDTDTHTDSLELSLKTLPEYGEMRFNGRKVQASARILYKELQNKSLCYYHNGDENIRDDFVIVASDGIQSSKKRVFIDIIPVNDKRPRFSRESERISVMEASSVVLDSKLFKVIDEDSHKNNLSFLIMSEPTAGRITLQEQYTNNFTQGDIENGQLVYSHSEKEIGPYVKHDLFRVRVCDVIPFLANCSSVLTVQVDVIPVNSRPPKLAIKGRLKVRESGRVLLDERTLNCTDNDTVPHDIEVQIMNFPRFGFLENISPSEGSELSNAGVHISVFKCSDLKARTIYYVQSNHSGIEPRQDNFTMIAFDGKFQSSITELKIDITPSSDEDPKIDNDVIKVHEGGWKLIDSKFIKITDADLPKETLFFYVESFPKHGQMFYRCAGVDPGLKRLNVGQKLRHEKCILVYGHDDSESRSDKFSLAATDGRKIVKAEIHIQIIPVNDQRPEIVKNITMTVRYGIAKNISKSYLKSRDLDTPDELIEYKISTLPKYGTLMKRDVTTGVHIPLSVKSTFKQSDINTNAISYTNHLMPVEGFIDLFRFSITDGVHESKDMTFYIRIKQSCRKYLNIIIQNIQANSPRVVLTDSNLRVETRTSGSPRILNAISYQIIKPPSRGVLTLSGKQKNERFFSFAQFDLNQKRLQYRPNEYPLKYNDSFKFLVTDGKCLQRGKIHIFVSKVREKIKLLDRNSILNVVKVGLTTITPLELRAMEKHSPKDVIYKIEKSPEHGVLLKDGQNATNFTQADINELSLGYKLVNVKATKDKFQVKMFLRNKQEDPEIAPYENFTFNIKINIPRKLEPRIITNQPITALEYLYPNVLGTVITKRNLLTYNCLSMQDVGLVYTVIEPPIHGELFHKETGKPVSLFTQKDINEGRILYKLTDKRLLSYDDKIFLEVSSGDCKRPKQIEFSIHWSVVTLLDDISVQCSLKKTTVVIKLQRLGYNKQGSVVEVYLTSIGDEKKSFPSSRIWFYPNEFEKRWVLPQSVMEYELINVQLKNEFNTLLGKKKSLVVDVSKAADSCLKQRKTDETMKQKPVKDVPDTKNTSVTSSTGDASFHAIRLVKPLSGNLSRREKEGIFHKSSIPCQEGWSEFNMNCYKLIRTASNWRKATKTCRKNNATLLIPLSPEEERFTDRMHVGTSVWLGIKQNKRGRWKWNAKKNRGIIQRKLEMISKSSTNGKKCVSMNDKGQWKVIDCRKNIFAFICKKQSY